MPISRMDTKTELFAQKWLLETIVSQVVIYLILYNVSGNDGGEVMVPLQSDLLQCIQLFPAS